MSDKLADEVNRLRVEGERLSLLVEAALDSRTEQARLVSATMRAGHSDIKLAELGIRFMLPAEQ